MKPTRILVLGKSFPELGNRDMEMLCTVGCTSEGKPVRFHPVPLRYLPNHVQYRPHDWVMAPIARSSQDHRPEAHNVMSKEIMLDGRTIPNRGWMNLERYIYTNTSWHYTDLETLQKAQKSMQVSVGFVKVSSIKEVRVINRSEEACELHTEKLNQLQRQGLLTEDTARLLAFQPYRIFVQWTSSHNDAVHESEINSWKLLRHVGKMSEATAIRHLWKLLDADAYDLGFFMASFKDDAQNFKVVGLWHPKRQDVMLQKAQLKLF